MAQQLAGLAGILQNIQVPPGVYPRFINLPTPPKLEGALAPNDWLTRAQKHANNRVFGPESMVVFKGYVYTGQADGWVVEINPFGMVRRLVRLALRSCGRLGSREGACGRPMGIRLDSMGFLIVADAYHGIFRINPKTGRFRQLVNTRIHRANNRPLGYINDLAVAKDGTVFFTSSSTKWSLAKENNIILEGENTGRLLFYNPRERRLDKQVQELVTELTFPNGLQLSKDESYLLLGEGSRSRILRIWLGPNPPIQNRMEVFANNLPGVVDNIRLSPRGTYWVGLTQSRHLDLPSVLDTYGKKPKIRGALISLINSRIAFDDPDFGIVVELDGQGQVIQSLQDPKGQVYTGVSEVEEENGILFLASPDKKFIGFLKLPSSSSSSSSTLPPDRTGSGTGSTGTGSTGTDTGSSGSGSTATGSTGSGTSGAVGTGPLSQNPRVIEFLTKVRKNMMKMTVQRVKQVVLELVKQLIIAKRQAFYLRRMALAREEDLRRIKIALRQLQQSSGAGSGTTSPTGADGMDTTTAGATDTTRESPTVTSTISAGGSGATTTATTITTTAADPTTASGSGSTSGPDSTSTSGTGGSGNTGAETGSTSTTGGTTLSSASTTASSGGADTITGNTVDVSGGDATSTTAGATTASGAGTTTTAAAGADSTAASTTDASTAASITAAATAAADTESTTTGATTEGGR